MFIIYNLNLNLYFLIVKYVMKIYNIKIKKKKKNYSNNTSYDKIV